MTTKIAKPLFQAFRVTYMISFFHLALLRAIYYLVILTTIVSFLNTLVHVHLGLPLILTDSLTMNNPNLVVIGLR